MHTMNPAVSTTPLWWIPFGVLFAILVLLNSWCGAQARDPDGRYAQSADRDWYQSAQLTEAAQQRFRFKSCCAQSDVVKTRFRAGADDGWDYVDDAGAWQRVPDDIIHHEEFSPHGEPVMFAVRGEPTCFFPPQGGG